MSAATLLGCMAQTCGSNVFVTFSYPMSRVDIKYPCTWQAGIFQVPFHRRTALPDSQLHTGHRKETLISLMLPLSTQPAANFAHPSELFKLQSFSCLVLNVLFTSSIWAFAPFVLSLAKYPQCICYIHLVSTPCVQSEKSFHFSKTLITKTDKDSVGKKNYNTIMTRNRRIFTPPMEFLKSSQLSGVYFGNARLT